MRKHDDVIKCKHFPRYWPFVRGIHRSPVNSPHKGQRRGTLMLPFICARIDSRVNNGEAGDLRRHRGHYDVIVMTVAHNALTYWGHDKMDAISQTAFYNAFFLNKNMWISITSKISLKFVPRDPVNSIPALVQIMAWRHKARSHYLTQWWSVYWRMYASLGLNELIDVMIS